MYILLLQALCLFGSGVHYLSSLLVWVLSFFQRNIFLGYTLGLCGFDVVAENDWDSVQRRRLDGANSLLFRLIQNIAYLLVFLLFGFIP